MQCVWLGVGVGVGIQHLELVSLANCSIYQLLDRKEEPVPVRRARSVPQGQIRELIIATEDENLKHGCD